MLFLNSMYLTACSLTGEASEPQEKSQHATCFMSTDVVGG